MAASELDKYEGKKVILVIDQGEGKDGLEVEGTAQAANEMGILLKPKGKTKLELIEADKIIEHRFAPETIKPLDRKTLKVVTFGQARSHLLERHGWTLGGVNKITEEAAYKLHSEIDHKEEDLGHLHESVSETPAAQAAAAAAEGDDAV